MGKLETCCSSIANWWVEATILLCSCIVSSLFRPKTVAQYFVTERTQTSGARIFSWEKQNKKERDTFGNILREYMNTYKQRVQEHCSGDWKTNLAHAVVKSIIAAQRSKGRRPEQKATEWCVQTVRNLVCSGNENVAKNYQLIYTASRLIRSNNDNL